MYSHGFATPSGRVLRHVAAASFREKLGLAVKLTVDTQNSEGCGKRVA